MKRAHAMPFGAEVRADGVRFRLWAPLHAKVGVALDERGQPLPMTALDDGWHELVTAAARAGTRYRFVLPDGLRVPDPAARFQPDDVHGPSEVIDPNAYAWNDDGWTGRPWPEAVIYELHVGTFTPAGTFRGAAERLPYLAELGVTVVELMPISDFPGRRNWGYDGVLPFAPDACYGRPAELKALVEAAHACGLAIVLDVVYNHFGPDGNYLGSYAPQFFNTSRQTPWGSAINYDGPGSPVVRRFATENALYWLEEYHFDGLRLDAVNTLVDEGERHLLDELAERARTQSGDRPVHLILENERNEVRWLRDYTAQWNDDMHHALHTAVTGESFGYYALYQGKTPLLARALADGFARGDDSRQLRTDAFIAFIQDHDQIGNRAFGERISALAAPEAVRAIAAVYLLLPQIPMLFMGEEWAAAEPFPFFCDFSGDLAAAVRRGRRAEFARNPAFTDPATRERIPDPNADATFASAKLDWSAREREPHAAWERWYRRILAARRAHVTPLVAQLAHGGSARIVGDEAVLVRWDAGAFGALELALNLSASAACIFPPAPAPPFWREGRWDGESAGPWSVRWTRCEER